MAGFKIDRVDHFVLTVKDVEKTCDFYGKVMGMEKTVFAGGRVALAFGKQKINLHRAGNEYVPHARQPAPGAGDFCLITETPIAKVIDHLKACGVAIEIGPTPKTGALGAITSVYFRDPDGNLVEVSNYD